jgi:nitroreductase
LDMLDIIKARRSVRRYLDRPVAGDLVDKILEAGRWAPSGLNNQPWRFAVVTDDAIKEEISKLTRYSSIVRHAKVLIPVFLDNADSYHRTKDAQAVGACLQNMLLEAHALGLGAVWLGEIIKSDKEIRGILGLGDDLELMAVLAVGYPDEKPKSGNRKELKELTVFRK